MAQQIETGPLQIKHGHNGTHVYIGFTRLIDNLLLTPAQAIDFLEAVKTSLDKLQEHTATVAAGKRNG